MPLWLAAAAMPHGKHPGMACAAKLIVNGDQAGFIHSQSASLHPGGWARIDRKQRRVTGQAGAAPQQQFGLGNPHAAVPQYRDLPALQHGKGALLHCCRAGAQQRVASGHQGYPTGLAPWRRRQPVLQGQCHLHCRNAGPDHPDIQRLSGRELDELWQQPEENRQRPQVQGMFQGARDLTCQPFAVRVRFKVDAEPVVMQGFSVGQHDLLLFRRQRPYACLHKARATALGQAGQ